MDLRRAQARQPEILRSVQKDDIYAKELAEDYKDVLHMFGTKQWIKYNELCGLIAAISYHGFAAISNLQTLGEEYTGIIQITSDFKRIPSRLLQLSAIILEFGGDFFYQKLLQKTEIYILAQEELEESQKQRLQYCLRTLRAAPPYIKSLHKSLFYLRSNKYQLSKRITGINYVLIRHWLQPEFSLYGYKILGLITLMQLLISLTVNGWMNWREHQKRLLNATTQKDSLSIKTSLQKSQISNKDCVLCLEACRDISLTPCGHLFCWHCILDWLDERDECPLCRENLQKSRIILLQNFN